MRRATGIQRKAPLHPRTKAEYIERQARHHPGRRPPKPKPRRVPEASRAVRAAVRKRSGGRCEECFIPFKPGERSDPHHVFYRSLVSRLCRNELWNYVDVHRACHDLLHKVAIFRRAAEAVAIDRLRRQVGPEVWNWLMQHRKGSTDAATIRAYELYKRTGVGR